MVRRSWMSVALALSTLACAEVRACSPGTEVTVPRPFVPISL